MPIRKKIIRKKLQENIEADIVFSLTAHEKPLFISKIIDNLNKYTEKYRVFIIINGSNNVTYENVKTNYDNVMFNPDYKPRRKYFYDVLGAHVDNYILLKKQNIKYKQIILLASNCLLFKQLDVEKFIYVDKTKEDIGRWINFHKSMENCKELVDIFLELKVPLSGNNKSVFSHIHHHHEGTVYSFEEAKKIFDFIIEKIHHINYKNYVAEEVILPYLEYIYFDKKLRPRIILMPTIEKPGTPGCEDLLMKRAQKTEGKFGIKGVDRKHDNPFFKKLL